VLSCVVSDNSPTDVANNTGWIRDDTLPVIVNPDNDMRFMIDNTRIGNVVTSVLTIESVSSSDNGTAYYCLPTVGIRSFNGILSVIGEYVQYVNYYTLCMYLHMCIKIFYLIVKQICTYLMCMLGMVVKNMAKNLLKSLC